MKITIVDYEIGNLFSVSQAFKSVGIDAVISSDIKEILESDGVVLPGVGAFGDAMDSLHKLDLVNPILDFIDTGKPFLGVCLGMQLLFSESNEFGTHKGLNIIEGEIKKFPPYDNSGEQIKVPHISWNQIFAQDDPAGKWQDSPLNGLKNGEYMYFIHSFYASPKYKENILSTTDYKGINFCSSVNKKNVFACQFHPEKSAKNGIQIYKNWANQITSKNNK
jgi:glutamine amidotransferase